MRSVSESFACEKVDWDEDAFMGYWRVLKSRRGKCLVSNWGLARVWLGKEKLHVGVSKARRSECL